MSGSPSASVVRFVSVTGFVYGASATSGPAFAVGALFVVQWPTSQLPLQQSPQRTVPL